jgi:hypothetical protein
MKFHIKVESTSPSCHWNDDFWQSEATYIAEIRTRDAPAAELGLIEKDFVTSQIRTKDHKNKPYIRGRVIDIQTVHDPNFCWKHITVMFNSEHGAWHYGWVSHKHSSNTPHVVDILVMFDSPALPTHYFLAGSYISPEFRITCTKRSRQRSSAPVDEESFEMEVIN